MNTHLRAALSVILLQCLLLTGCSEADPAKPDGAGNRKYYLSFFPGSPGQDVTGIYAYADEIWPDPVYAFCFTAPPSVVKQIIDLYGLKEEPNTDYRAPYSKSLNRLPWWSAAERQDSTFYYLIDDQKEVDYRLWYNPETQKCQVLIVYM